MEIKATFAILSRASHRLKWHHRADKAWPAGLAMKQNHPNSFRLILRHLLHSSGKPSIVPVSTIGHSSIKFMTVWSQTRRKAVSI